MGSFRCTLLSLSFFSLFSTAAGDTIVGTAVANGNFGVLAAALTEANLVDTLNGPGPFTVFAPTDAAFTALLEALGATADELLARSDLADILTYHVASGKVMSTDLSNGMAVTTLQGATATVGISGGTVTIQGATVTTADVVCSNGVIHIIDAVMLPPNIVQVAVAAGSFTTLAAALTQANLVDTLTGTGPFTVFAPTDAAFTALLTSLDVTAEQLLAREDLSAILTYHVASGKVMSGDLSDGMAVTTVQGSTLTVGISGGTVTIGDAAVTAADIVASNGVIHVIDKVLMPPAPAPSDATQADVVSIAHGALRAQVMPMLFGLMFLVFGSTSAF